MIVVDASVALWWIAPEEASDLAAELLVRTDLVAPDLIMIEVANAMRRKIVRGEVTRGQAVDGFRLLAGKLELVRPDTAWLNRSLDMAVAMGHPVYDCIYLALAEKSRGVVVTGDIELISRAERAGLGAFVTTLPLQ